LASLEGVLFPDAFFAGDSDPAVQGFISSYKQQYGEVPDYLATQGYLVISLLGQLAKSDGELSRSDLAARLIALKTVPQLPWFRGFNSQREEEAAIYLLTIKQGQIQMVVSRTLSLLSGL
jgi:substrate-binding family protein